MAVLVDLCGDFLVRHLAVGAVEAVALLNGFLPRLLAFLLRLRLRCFTFHDHPSFLYQ